MAVSALELRPRSPIALFDAAIRLTTRSSGVWALTLPAGALVTGSLLHWLDAIARGKEVLVPSALLVLAWFCRGVLQGAACHFLEGQLLGSAEPTVLGSLRQALGRLPSLCIAVAYLLVFNLVVGSLTFGLYFFFVGSHLAGYAVTMQGKGHPLSLYGTCSKALGPARAWAVWVRLCFWAQALVVLNIHIAANVLVLVGRKLLALDLTFVDRFVSLDNEAWVAAALALGFTLFEPLRASAATLLLVDGRVRQEGLDLLSAIEQLPVPHPKKTFTSTAAAVGLAAVGVLWAAPVQAEQLRGAPAPADAEEIRARLYALTDECGIHDKELSKQIDLAGGLSQKEHASLARFLAEVEGYAYDEGDCDYAKTRLRQGLPLIAQARHALEASHGAHPRTRAEEILARPEFAPDPQRRGAAPTPEKDAPSPPPGWWEAFKKWWSQLWKDFFDWLRRRSGRSDSELNLPLSGGAGGLTAANLIVIALVGGSLVFLAYLLLSRKKPEHVDGGEADVSALEETPLTTDPMSALSRSPEGWASLADELAARGQFREAVRSLYLALLSRLHRDGAIDYDPAKSNWDYFRGFRGRREWLAPFRELTDRFDFAYYGRIQVGNEGYLSFRELSRPLLSSPTEPGASHA
ncbi:MAG: DUF4129 domain-containing protein [Myxococcota bacterium]